MAINISPIIELSKYCIFFATTLKFIVMANLIHDYSKVSEARKLLNRAFYLLSPGDPSDIRDARKALSSARELLDKYLSSDNLIDDAGIHYSR